MAELIMIFKFLQKYPPSMMVNMSQEPSEVFIERYIRENPAPEDIEFDEYFNKSLMNHPDIKKYSEKKGFIRYFMDANFLCAHYLERIKEYDELKEFFEDYVFYTVITEQIGFVPNQYAGDLNIRLSIMQCDKRSKFIQDYEYGTLNKKLSGKEKLINDKKNEIYKNSSELINFIKKYAQKNEDGSYTEQTKQRLIEIANENDRLIEELEQ